MTLTRDKGDETRTLVRRGSDDQQDEQQRRKTKRQREIKLEVPSVNITKVIYPMVYIGLACIAAFVLLPPITATDWVIVGLLGLLAIWTVLQHWLDPTRNRSIPTIGAPKTVRRISWLMGLTYTPNKSIAELIGEEGEKHFRLTQSRSAIIGVFGPKGGVGKTTVATGIAWFASFFNKLANLLVDSREKRGHLAEYNCLWRRDDGEELSPDDTTTITLNQALEMLDAGFFETAEQTHRLLGTAPGRMLQVIASDNVLDDVEGLSVDITRVRALFEKLREHYRLIIFECPDELKTEMAKMLMEIVDIPIFVHRVDSDGSDSETRQGIAVNMKRHGEKIRMHGVLFALATSRKTTADQISDEMGGHIPPERTFLIRKDKWFGGGATDKGHDKPEFKDTTHRPAPTRPLEDTPLHAVLAYMQAVNAGLETLDPSEPTQRPPIVVVPLPPTVIDGQTISIPKVEGVQYLVNGETVDEGEYPATSVIDVEPKYGYTLKHPSWLLSDGDMRYLQSLIELNQAASSQEVDLVE